MATGDAKLQGWFTGRLPDDWFTGSPEVTYDRDEILVLGTLAEPDARPRRPTPRNAGPRLGARVEQFREDTRQQRMRIADEAEQRFGRKVAWGVELRRRSKRSSPTSACP